MRTRSRVPGPCRSAKHATWYPASELGTASLHRDLEIACLKGSTACSAYGQCHCQCHMCLRIAFRGAHTSEKDPTCSPSRILKPERPMNCQSEEIIILETWEQEKTCPAGTHERQPPSTTRPSARCSSQALTTLSTVVRA